MSEKKKSWNKSNNIGTTKTRNARWGREEKIYMEIEEAAD